jgi:hypothetical protein
MFEDQPLLQVSNFVKTTVPQTPVAVIFDLDSTLFCVSPRTRAILQKLASDPGFQSQFETESKSLLLADVHPTDWGIKTVLLRHTPNAPLEFFRRVRDYWRSHFFSSRFLHEDVVYPFADEYVRHLEELGAEIYYLIGRPESAMREGTLNALSRWNFPLASPAHLLMKPDAIEEDEHFKTLALKELAQKFSHIWFFENEPVIIHEVRAALPQIRIVFVDSVHSGKAAPPKDLPQIGMSYQRRS